MDNDRINYDRFSMRDVTILMANNIFLKQPYI